MDFKKCVIYKASFRNASEILFDVIKGHTHTHTHTYRMWISLFAFLLESFIVTVSLPVRISKFTKELVEDRLPPLLHCRVSEMFTWDPKFVSVPRWKHHGSLSNLKLSVWFHCTLICSKWRVAVTSEQFRKNAYVTVFKCRRFIRQVLCNPVLVH